MKVILAVRLIKDLSEMAARFNIVICDSCYLEYRYRVFQESVRRGVIIGIHKGYSSRGIAKLLNVPEWQIENHLRLLREVEFVIEKRGGMVPAFFIALREDVLRVKKVAKRLGVQMGYSTGET